MRILCENVSEITVITIRGFNKILYNREPNGLIEKIWVTRYSELYEVNHVYWPDGPEKNYSS